MRSSVRSRSIRIAVVVVLLAVAVVAPLNSSPYINFQLALIAVWAVAILGLNFAAGYNGQLSLGQSAFVGVGAYSTVFGVRSQWPDVVTLLFAAIVAGVIGFIVALPTARLRGSAVALVTITLPIVAIPLANRFPELTGGAAGTSVDFAHAPGWSGLFDDQWRFYVVAFIAALLYLGGRNLVRGKFGRSMMLVRDDELVASANGISGYWTRVMALTVSSAYGGAAGFMYVVAVQYVSPNVMLFLASLYLVAALIIGGRASLLGSVFGAVFYVLVPVAASQIDASQTTLIYGAVLLVFLFLLPDGIVSLPSRIRTMRRRREPTTSVVVAADGASREEQHESNIA